MTGMKRNYDGIILAAGMSTRMGKWKLTMPFLDSTIIEVSVTNALKVCRRVILVGGYKILELEELFLKKNRLIIVENKKYQRGMFSSIKTAVPLVETDRFFISLGDMPMINPDIYSYIQQFSDTDVVIPQYRGKKGHPVFLSSKVGERILQFDDSSTMRDVMSEFLNLLVPVNDEYILHDIDTETDYETFSKYTDTKKG